MNLREALCLGELFTVFSPQATSTVAVIVMSDAAGVGMTSTLQWSPPTPHDAWLRTVLSSVVKGLGPKVPISRVAYVSVT